MYNNICIHLPRTRKIYFNFKGIKKVSQNFCESNKQLREHSMVSCNVPNSCHVALGFNACESESC